MKPIRVLTRDFELKAEIDNYESLQFTRSWHGLGDVEMHINLYKKDTKELQKNRLLVLSPDKVGIIKHREIPLNENGKASENWMIKGYELKSIVSHRITIPPSTTAYDNKSGNAETVMKHYVDRNLVNPDNPDRKIPNLVLAPNQNRGESISWQSRYKNVAEELENISLSTGLGWGVYLDYANKQFVFDVFEGKDVTVNQSVNPPVIFSPEFESIKSQGFVDSDLNMQNVGYIGGQGEGVQREVITIGNKTGLDRIETFVDARNVETTDELTEQGIQKMAELETELFFEAEILSPVTRTTYNYEHESFVNTTQAIGGLNKKKEVYSTFRYGEDYDLGYIATLQNKKWGVTMHSRITSLKEIYEPSGFKLEAIFGKDRPTLISKINRELAQFENEIKR